MPLGSSQCPARQTKQVSRQTPTDGNVPQHKINPSLSCPHALVLSVRGPRAASPVRGKQQRQGQQSKHRASVGVVAVGGEYSVCHMWLAGPDLDPDSEEGLTAMMRHGYSQHQHRDGHLLMDEGGWAPRLDMIWVGSPDAAKPKEANDYFRDYDYSSPQLYRDWRRRVWA